MKKARKVGGIFLCSLLVGGIGAAQIVPAIAKGECTCEIGVHGSNCPLSQCICEEKEREEHGEECPLFGKSGELTRCVCEPDIHAGGCPRYEVEGMLLEGTEEASGVLETEPPEPEESGMPEPSPEGTPEPVEMEEDPDLPVVTEEEPEEKVELPSDGESSGEVQMQGKEKIAAEMEALERALDEYIEEVRRAISNGGSARILEREENSGDVLAVYAVLTGQTENYPVGVSVESEEEVETLHSVYWSMTQATGVSNREGSAICVKRLTAEEGAKQNGLSGAESQEAIALAGKGDAVF